MEVSILKKLQRTELEILKDIDRVCRENNIHYFVIYGTLLGAIRHSGFIPWDDDIDIGMARDDFEKFIKIANNYLKENYKVDYFNANKIYYLPFAKVRNINTVFNENVAAKYKGNKGIYVDIFPFDNIKYDHHTKCSRIKLKIENVLHAIMLHKSTQNVCSKKIRILSKFMSNRFANFLIKKISHGSSKYEYLIHYHIGGMKYSKIYSKANFFPVSKMEFNGFNVSVPKNSDEMLRKFYGDDYMTPPPMEKRKTHNPLYIQFEDGEAHNFEDK